MDRSERLGLGLSATGHILLFAMLALGLMRWQSPKPIAPPAIDVTIADEVALESRTTSQATPDVAEAPEIGKTEPDATPPPPEAVTPPEPVPAPVPKPVVQPEPKKPVPTPVQKKPEPTKSVSSKLSQAIEQTQKAKPQRAPRLGADFLKGLDTAEPKPAAAAPGAAAPLSAVATRALNAEINRQIKPYWNPPTGADADKLVTIVAVNLAQDGSLQGSPRILSQTGVTASNASQKTLHAENALRAIRRAAPFKLPPDLYDAWQSLEIRFDFRLSR